MGNKQRSGGGAALWDSRDPALPSRFSRARRKTGRETPPWGQPCPPPQPHTAQLGGFPCPLHILWFSWSSGDTRETGPALGRAGCCTTGQEQGSFTPFSVVILRSLQSSGITGRDLKLPQCWCKHQFDSQQGDTTRFGAPAALFHVLTSVQRCTVPTCPEHHPWAPTGTTEGNQGWESSAEPPKGGSTGDAAAPHPVLRTRLLSASTHSFSQAVPGRKIKQILQGLPHQANK